MRQREGKRREGGVMSSSVRPSVRESHLKPGKGRVEGWRNGGVVEWEGVMTEGGVKALHQHGPQIGSTIYHWKGKEREKGKNHPP
jgi:hypothetical protein